MITNKKIMMITTTDNMIWQFLIPHIKHLQELGNEVQCVCAKTGFWFDELKEKYGFKMHEIDFKRSPISFSNFKNYKKLKEVQKQEKFDLVYCQQPVGGLMGRLIGKKFKIPVIYTAHGFHFFKGAPLKNRLIFKPVEKYLSKYTDILITINEEDYQAALKMKAKKVFKINGIGIDENKMVVEPFNKDEFKKSLGLNLEDKVILTVSEMNWNKNYISMLDAMKVLIKKDSSYKFVSCGTGEWKDKIPEYAKELGIEKNCIFLGYRKDISKIMQVSDLFLHASHREGLTLSVMEAMAVGLPCVVSNVRGNRDLVVDTQGGFVVEVEDYENYANKIEQILTTDELKKKMSEFNKEESKKYTIQNVKKQLQKIYEELN